jgi:hypothetical protein
MIVMTRVTFVAMLAAVSICAAPAAAQSSSPEKIEYPSVAAALSALQAKPGVKFTRNADWTIANDTDGSIWSFAPSSHFAYPAVGQRQLIQRDGGFFVQTRILCEAQKAACDRLRDDYNELDRRMTEAIRGKK